MNWFLFALVGPILWAATNHIDKFLLSKYIKGQTTGALMLFTGFFSIISLPVAFYFSQNIFQISFRDILLIIGSGILYLLGIIPYLYALNKDEASIVIPMFQTVPI